ncbi:MAG: cation-transporting P-type ATPase, partial [Desulfurococcaceae archaeon]
VEEVVNVLSTNLQSGLSSSEAERRLRVYGLNEIPVKKKSPLVMFARQFANFLIGILLVATAVSAFLGEIVDALAIFAVVLLMGVFGFIQEYRSEKTLEALKRLAMLNTDRTRVYAVVLENDRRGIEIRSFGVTAAGWSIHVNQERLAWYSSGAWYTIVVHYSVSGTTINIVAYFYDSGGTLRLSASTTITHGNVFVPAYIGVIADGLTAQYDEFIISTVDPRSVYFAGFYTGMRVEVWDNLGYLVNSTTAPASAFILNVTGDLVVGTGIDGKILVRYPDTYLCGRLSVPLDNAVLGGDVYALATSSISINLGSNKTSANVSLRVSGASLFNTTTRFLRLNTTQVLYARLILDAFTTSYALNLDMWIEGITSSTNISIRNGVPVSTFTSIVQLNLGGNNFIALSGYFTAMNEMAVVKLKLELCTALGGQGACVYYPVELILSS